MFSDEIIFFSNGNYNVSSEEHLKKSKSSRDSYLDLQLSNLVKLFEIYIVTQSLEGNRITSFNCLLLVCRGGEGGGGGCCVQQTLLRLRRVGQVSHVRPEQLVINLKGTVSRDFRPRYRWCTLTCEYRREFSKKFETVLMGYSGAGGKLIHEKNQKQKISWHCPFKHFLQFWQYNIYFYPWTENAIAVLFLNAEQFFMLVIFCC
jgi:hypothetical protein